MKKLLSSILLISLLFFAGTLSFATDNSLDVIDIETAQKIATNFAVARAQFEDTEESFPLPFKVVFDEEMYDFEGNVSAYKFDVVNSNEEYSGYIITGAQTEYAPIVEYSTSKTESFIDSAKTKISDNEKSLKIYYNGGFDYFVECSETESVGIYNAADGSVVAKTVAMLAENTGLNKLATKINNNHQFEKLWNSELAQVRLSNPPIDEFISDPLNYETGYSSYSMKYIAGATANMYRLMSSFSDGCGFHCGPTAATNLCILNYQLNGKTNLILGSWDNTFTKLHTLAKCDCGPNGTYDNILTVAIENYGKNQGYSSTTATLDITPTVNEMKNSINNNIPQILLVNGHGYYVDHYVLSIGFEQYNYTNETATYFRVIDGWSTSSRYIIFNDDYMTSTITAEFN